MRAPPEEGDGGEGGRKRKGEREKKRKRGPELESGSSRFNFPLNWQPEGEKEKKEEGKKGPEWTQLMLASVLLPVHSSNSANPPEARPIKHKKKGKKAKRRGRGGSNMAPFRRLTPSFFTPPTPRGMKKEKKKRRGSQPLRVIVG